MNYGLLDGVKYVEEKLIIVSSRTNFDSCRKYVVVELCLGI